MAPPLTLAFAPAAPSPSPSIAPQVLAVIPNATATQVTDLPPLIPSPPPASSTPVSYFPDSDSAASSSAALAAPETTSMIKPSSLSSTSARTLGIVLGTVIGLALLTIAIVSFYLCCRKRGRRASVYRSHSFRPGPPYPSVFSGEGTDSAATSKEAFTQYRPRGSIPELPMSDLDTRLPNRPPSVLTYASAPGTPVHPAEPPQNVPAPFTVYAYERSVKAVKAGSPVKAIITHVITASPESIHARRASPASSSLGSSPTGSTSSTPETRNSHETVPTPPTSPMHGRLKSEQGTRPKLAIITTTINVNGTEVPQVPIAPLRLPPAAFLSERGKPEYARLLFAAGMSGSSSGSSTVTSPQQEMEDLFSPAASPVRSEHTPSPAPPEIVSKPEPPSIVITSPEPEWQETPDVSGAQLELEEDGEEEEDEEEYASDEQEDGDHSDPEDVGDIDDEEDITSEGFRSPTTPYQAHYATPSRAITVDLTLPLTMSPSHPSLPSGFPTSVTFASNASTSSPTQGLPMTFASRRELTSPTGFPQSPWESADEFEEDGDDFSPVLAYPTMRDGKSPIASASFRIFDVDPITPPTPIKRPDTAEERLRGLGIGTVCLPTITVTEWSEGGLMSF